MNEYGTGQSLRKVKHIRCHLWHRYSVTVNKVRRFLILSNGRGLAPGHQWGLSVWHFGFVCALQYLVFRYMCCRALLTNFNSWLITGFVTRVTRRVPLVEQELLILPEHLSSPLAFNCVRVTRSLVFLLLFKLK
jgi:hypothetical protein